MGSFSLSTGNLFVRSAGKTRVMVVKLSKDVHSSVVEMKDWEVVETIGINMSYDTLEVFGHKIRGQELKRLALNLCDSRLWVNMDGISFIRLGVTSISFHVVFYQTNDLFYWVDYGVNKSNSKTTKNDDKEDLKKELNEYKDKVTAKDEEITKLNAKSIQDDRSIEDLKKKEKELEDEKKNVAKLKEDGKKKDTEITKLNKELKQSSDDKQKEIKKKDDEIARLNGIIRSSSTISAVSQFDQILHKWRRPVWPSRFVSVNSSYYSPDFSSMPTYRAVDTYVQGQYPHDINVYVSNSSFQKDNWWFIKIRDENTSSESLFAFYGGIYDSTTTSGGFLVKVPYSSSATFRANVRFLSVALRGYGAVFGFCYNH